MRKLGYAEKWIDLVMKCITSVSYEILINSYPREHSCQYRMAVHGSEPKIRHKNMAGGMASYGGLKIYIYKQKIYKKKNFKNNK